MGARGSRSRNARRPRNVARLVGLIAALASHVAGTVASAFGSRADRHGAYVWLANAGVGLTDLAQAIWIARARHCAKHAWVYVPIDGSSLALRDPHGTRGTGHVESRAAQGRGVIVHSAITVTAAGVVHGLCAQMLTPRRWSTATRSAGRSSFSRRVEVGPMQGRGHAPERLVTHPVVGHAPSERCEPYC